MTDSLAKFSAADEIGHVHSDVSGGWLRASTFGAMDGLVTNISLVAGVGAAGASSRLIVLTGVAGLVAGAFSMALGEYTSVQTQNEQVDREWRTEGEEILNNPVGEERELSHTFMGMGMREVTARAAARDIHQDPEKSALVHVTQELGLDPREKPSPRVAAISSFVTFSLGALIPLLTYLFGSDSLVAALSVGSLGLLAAGAIASRFTIQSWWKSALRQLCFGAIAAGATYLVGVMIGVGVT